MKLHKANNNGSLSITLPKSLIETLGWKENDNVVVLGTEHNHEIRLINGTVKNWNEQNR